MERPDVDSIDGLSPAISIEQKTTSRSPRSTVGTITEIYDYLRVLYSSIGIPYCPLCGSEISRQTTEQILKHVLALRPDDRIMVMAPVVRGRKGEYRKDLEKLSRQGFVRARIDGILRSLDEWRARRRDVFPREWKTGAPILYLGRELALAIHPARKSGVAADLLNLTVLHPTAQDERQVSAFVVRWLREEAARLLVPRVAEFAGRITSALPAVKFSNARSEWGSCTQNGLIRLNWRLVQLPPDLALYIVAHEVAHLVELNHSRRFWALVETLFPGHAAARRALDEWTALLEA